MLALNTLSSGSYNTIRFTFLSNVESYVPTLYNDGLGIATIGLGFNLRDDAIRNWVLLELTGGSIPTGLDADIEAIVDNAWTDGIGGTLNQINAVMASYHSTYSNVPTTLEFSSTTSANNVYQNIVGQYEDAVNNRIANVADSYERVALFSLAYNSASLIGTRLQAAINDGNRAEAWYEIRYESNANQLNGLAKRRYYESEMFGLYKDVNNITDTEAKDVFRMIGRHEGDIDLYDTTYGSQVAAANIDYDTSVLRTGEVQTFSESKQFAFDFLVNTYASGYSIEYIFVDFIHVGQTQETNSHSGTSSTDLIFGESGDDVLDGGQDIDVIYGGAGNDTIKFKTLDNSFFAASDELLFGGSDTDTLQINLTTGELTNALKDEILAVYHNWTTVQTGTNKYYDFSVLRLNVTGFEQLVVTLESQTLSLATLAKNDEFMLLENGNNSGNLFSNNGFGADYTFGSTLTATAGTYTTVNGGTIVISNDGTFAFTALANFVGVDSYSYTITDTAGATSNATAYFNVQDEHTGTSSSDTMNYGSGSAPVRVSGDGGGDTITGTAYADYLNGGSGADMISGGGGHDYLVGGDDNDNLTGNIGNDFLVGESGDDSLTGGNGNDVLNGSIGNDTLGGDDGDDQLDGGDGNDTINGGAGADAIYGGAGNDNVSGNDNNDIVYGNDGDDIFQAEHGNDYLDGGAGFDTYQSNNLTSGITVDLTLSSNQVVHDGYGFSDTLLNIEKIMATSFNDSVTGSSNGELIYSYAGDDFVKGNDGNDEVYLGSGTDTAYGDDGNDTISGDSGNKTIYGGEGNDSLYTSTGDDTIDAGNGNNLVTAGDGTNTISAGAGSDTLHGGSGVDTITGGAGNDVINSFAGNDLITAGDGDDQIAAGVGNDWIDGGAGFDRYVSNVFGDATITQGSVIDLSLSSGQVINDGRGTTDTVFNIERFDTSSFDDQLSMDSTNSTINSGNGNDTINARGGSDTVNAGGHNDLVIHDLQDNSGALDIYDAGSGTDTLEFRSTGYTSAQKEDILKLRNATLTASSILALQSITGFETFKVYKNGTELSLDLSAKNDSFTAGNSAPYSGNVLVDNGNGADYSFADSYYIVAASISTTAGGTVSISSNGNFTYTAPTNYTGNDSFNYTLRDVMGSNSVGTVTLTVGSIMNGTTGNDTLTGTSSSDTIYGLAGNDTLNGGAGADTLIGGLGDDTYVVDNTGDTVTEASGEGTDLVQSSVSYTLSANVENLTLTNNSVALIGTGNSLDNVLTGNAYLNTLYGGAGNDTLDGGTDSDTMYGQDGNDAYYIDLTTDTVSEVANEGTDTVYAAFTYTLPTNVENLVLTGSSTANATGNALNNILTGNSSNNTLNGGTGNDTMTGGAGNDTYLVDSTDDIVVENSGEGTDNIQTSVSYIMSGYIENITLTGTGNVNATGNALMNSMTGNSGDNILDGGAGVDELYGGAGNDTYIVDNESDWISDTSGTDTVASSISYIIGSGMENLTLTGSANINGTGNAAVNNITGNSGNNILDGISGNDTLAGGAGNDTYVYYIGNTLVEAGNEGTDTVQTRFTYTLEANIENAIVTGTSSTGLTGNGLDNTLTGNYRNNTLDGAGGNDTLDGGWGNDTMYGGIGNDTYLVGEASDNVVEYSSEGIDHVIASHVNYTLPSNVENLTLDAGDYWSLTGNGLDNILTANNSDNTLTAHAGNDTLYGNGGADTLNGGDGNDTLVGGAGADTLNGGNNNDTYVFNDTAFTGIDAVNGFNSSDDNLKVSDLLVGFDSGTDDISDFVSFATSGSNSLMYVDRDGTAGTYSSVQVATLNSITGLDADTLCGNGHLIA